MKTTKIIRIFLIILILIILAVKAFKTLKLRSEAKPERNLPDKKYLVFEMTNVADLEPAIKKLVKILDPNNNRSKRMFGFGVNCIPLLSRSISNLQNKINNGFDLAEKYDVPVFFHIDPMYGFGSIPQPLKEKAPEIEYWKHPKMCEWVNFPTNGQSHGKVPRSWINWGSWLVTASANPCFESPHFKKFVTAQLKNGIAKVITKRLKKLRKEKKEYLFIGLNIGWETHLINNRKCLTEKQSIVCMYDTNMVMQKWETAQSGYAALHYKGWNEKKLIAEAKKQNISKEKLFYDFCGQIVHDYLELLAKSAYEAGLPTDKIYTHIVAVQSVETNTVNTDFPPIWAAVNDYSIPGFTLCNESGATYDIKELKKLIKNADPKKDKFAAIETYLSHHKTEKRFTDYMNEVFQEDNPIMVIYGALQNDNHGINPKPANETKAIINWLRPPAKRYEMTGKQ
ncbi:MAG: hypothetical protein DRI44_00140 [Chlamydiae bacterium]|nr:MAG: hypothetical protein DRI44_00140 [Chlamydiota bacterium]